LAIDPGAPREDPIPMQSAPRCLACGGYRLSPRTPVQAATGFPYLIYKSPSGGFFDQGVRLAVHGSACADCGHVMLFLNDRSLEELRAHPPLVPWGE